MKTVLISAGHNDKDPGAVGNGYKEAILAVKMRDRVAKSLRERGLKVFEDGADGVNEPLNRAIQLCKQVDIAVEIHFNAGPPTANGVEALAKLPLRRLSQDMCMAIGNVAGLKLRGGDQGYKRDDSGQHHRLGFCDAGGVILEVCFISSASDMAAYVAKKEAVAEAVSLVLAKHAGWVDSGSGA